MTEQEATDRMAVLLDAASALYNGVLSQAQYDEIIDVGRNVWPTTTTSGVSTGFTGYTYYTPCND